MISAFVLSLGVGFATLNALPEPGAGPAATAGSTASPVPAARVTDGPSLSVLAERLTGSFSSAAQAAKDPENYYDIRLHGVRVWESRTDGVWLYIEQATAKMPEKPYRQRVYHLTEPSKGTFRSDVYTLPDAKAAVNCWKDAATLKSVFEGLTPDKLTLRDGCSITLVWKASEGGVPGEGAFVGGTSGTECASDLRDAKYATSEVSIFADQMISWDRGYDAKGKQVWGASKGGYVFVRGAGVEPASK